MCALHFKLFFNRKAFVKNVDMNILIKKCGKWRMNLDGLELLSLSCTESPIRS